MRHGKSYQEITPYDASFLDNVQIGGGTLYRDRLSSFIGRIGDLTVSELLNYRITPQDVQMLRDFEYGALDDSVKDVCRGYEHLLIELSRVLRHRFVYEWLMNMDMPGYRFLRRQLMDIRTASHPLYAVYDPVTLDNLKVTLRYIIKSPNGLGAGANLNWVDVSHLQSLNGLFSNHDSRYNTYGNFVFHGDVSLWNVSNVTDMREMFAYSSFDGDISGWRLNPGCDTRGMFDHAVFSGQFPAGYKRL